MRFETPIVETELQCGTVYLTPLVTAHVYLAPGQREPSLQQIQDVVTDAYVQAARRGEVGVIKNVTPKP